MSKSCRRSGLSFCHGVRSSAGGRSFDLSARVQRRPRYSATYLLRYDGGPALMSSLRESFSSSFCRGVSTIRIDH